jgi:hypothetical protein
MSWGVGRRNDIIIRTSSTDAMKWQGARMNKDECCIGMPGKGVK